MNKCWWNNTASLHRTTNNSERNHDAEHEILANQHSMEHIQDALITLDVNMAALQTSSPQIKEQTAQNQAGTKFLYKDKKRKQQTTVASRHKLPYLREYRNR